MDPMPAAHLSQKLWVALGLATSAGLAGLGDAAPTGEARWDTVLRCLFAVVVPVAVAASPRWLWFGALAVTGGLAAGLPWLGLAGVAMVLAGVVEVTRTRGPAGRVAVGIAVAHGLLHLRPIGPFATSAAIAAAVVVVCSVAALWGDSRSWRGPVGAVVASVLAAVAAATVAVGAVAFTARGDIVAGSEAARLGLEAARDGDSARATTQLALASAALDRVDRKLGSWWVEPARLVPVLSQHVAAARAATGPLGDIADAAGQAVTLGDVEQLRLMGGRIDLARIEAMSVPLAEVDRSIGTALTSLDEADSPWLLPPLRSRLSDAAAELAEAAPDARKAADGTRVLPGLLGADGPREYLVMFAMPAEAREFGGIMGTYLTLTAVDGRLRVGDQGSAGELNLSGPGTLTDPSRFPARFMANRPDLFTTNWTGMTDLPLIAQAVAELYPSFGGNEIDGVIYLDPVGVAGLLELTGPVELPEIGRTIDAENVVDFLTVEQYAIFDDSGERKDYLTDIAGQTFTELLLADLPSPRTLATVLGPAARGGHLQMATLDSDANEFLDSIFLLGAYPRPDGSDLLSVVQANGEANKIDTFLRRSVDYRVVLDDETGTLEATVEVRLTNTAPPGLPDYVVGTPPDGQPVGTNRVHLSIISPHTLQEVTIDSIAEPPELQQELGWQRYLVFVDVAPGVERVVTFQLTGQFDPSEPSYRILVEQQASIVPDEVRIVVTDSGGASIGEATLTLVEDEVVEFDR